MQDTQFKPYTQWGARISGELFIIDQCRTGTDAGKRSNLFGRTDIKEFSQTSRKRMRRYLRESETDWYSMLTITYPKEIGQSDAKASKEDLRVFLQSLRRAANNDKPFSVFWFIEFQGNGSIHYHLFCTHGYSIEFIRSKWADCVARRYPNNTPEHNSAWSDAHKAGSRIEKIRSGRGGIAQYALKYASKSQQKDIPAVFLQNGGVGRFWGVVNRGERMAAVTKLDSSVLELPSVQKIRKYIENYQKSAIYSGKLVDITDKISDIPAGVQVMRFVERSDAKTMQKLVFLMTFAVGVIKKQQYPLKMSDADMFQTSKTMESINGLSEMVIKDRETWGNADRMH